MSGIDRVIVGASGSPGSLRALRFGERLARVHDAVLMPVLAWDLAGGEGRSRLPPTGDLRRACGERARQRLHGVLMAVWGEEPSDKRVQPHVERGPAGWVLVNLADRPGDLLVIGAGRRGRVARLVWSGVSRYCLAHARCPVLAIPPSDLAGELRHVRLAWAFRHRSLDPGQILGNGPPL
jgi:nucleotide-binding universal stress UspA family protein